MTELFDAIIKTSFQGSIVILAVIALRFLLKKAPKSLFCLLWLLAGLRLVLPFEIQSPFSLQPQLEDTNLSSQAHQPVQVPDILVQNPVGQPLDTPADPIQTPNLPEGNWENPQTENLLHSQQEGVLNPISYGDIAAQLWLVGMAVMLTASAFSYIRLKCRVREAYLIENGCFECPGLDTAFVLGFLPPKIYLPMGLTDQEKKFIFDHENTHIARHDHWFKVLGYGILSIHWFNPLVWLGYSLLCRDMELACDEHVVKYMTLPQRKAYSAALLSCGGRTARFAACPVAFGESNPKKRILNVLNYKRPSFWIILLAVVAVIFVSVCLLTSPEHRQEAPEEELKWNLELKADNVSPTGLTVEFIQHGPFQGYDRAELHFGSYYTLEKWVDGNWESVKMLPQEYDVAWTMEAYIIKRSDTTTQRISWGWLYGELPEGKYRIGKDVDLFRNTGDYDSEMFWAEFTIEETEPQEPAWSMDMTDEEYLTMCRNAVANLQSREQFHISEILAYFTGETEDSRSDVVFWRDGENWLRQSYVTRMRENRNLLYYDGLLYMQRQKEGEEAVWDLVDSADPDRKGMTWLHWLQWDNQSVVFNSTGQEAEELRVSVTVHATPPTLGWDDVQEYNILFFFDKAGNLTRAIMSAHSENIKVIDDLRIETTLGSNIHKKLENAAAQRPGAPQISLTEEQWQEKCRTALEAYQSQGNWVVLVENQNSGEAVLTENSSQLWYIHGKDWARQGIISNADFLQENWHLHKDSHCYSRESCTIHYPANGDGYCNGWQDFEDISDWPLPWPVEFDWDSEEITFVDAGNDGNSDWVRFLIQGSPMPVQELEEVKEYYVTFWLRPSGEVWTIQLEYTETQRIWMNGEKRAVQEHIISTISLNAAAPEEAERMIRQCHDEALLHAQGICHNPDCTDAAHDHSGVSCTDEHCTNSTHSHHNDHHH